MFGNYPYLPALYQLSYSTTAVNYSAAFRHVECVARQFRLVKQKSFKNQKLVRADWQLPQPAPQPPPAGWVWLLCHTAAGSAPGAIGCRPDKAALNQEHQWFEG